MFQTASRGIASGRRVNELLNCEPAIKDGSYTDNPAVHGKIEFRNVSFAYPGMGDEKILDNINIVINSGETVGILGQTGCGKTSFVNLIPRFYDVTEGSVLVDDIDVREYNLKNLRKRISTALQKSEIFQSSIRDNIAWGNPDATEEQIKNAADIAQATEFISRTKEGFDTLVTQQGTSLSGGQKQRVAISRTILKDAEILIFDDSTSALDLKTEADLYSMLKEKYPAKTKIIIAQRIASVKDADRIIVLDNGKISAVGTHEELLNTSEIYKDIYNSQLNRK